MPTKNFSIYLTDAQYTKYVKDKLNIDKEIKDFINGLLVIDGNKE